ncbi:MAG: beta-ketoacyl-ACP synthase II [Chloroflexi bacterium]|nr:beta-ketoacyl-ACP synthase II [Chloroflexota bacterium]MBU1751546.1 beta-ketoacyl-ACP synthase II [Chloroflexota bacterium]
MRRRVVVTGLGAVTPLGNDVPTMWEGLLTGRSGIGRISSFDPSELEVQIAAEVKDFDPVALFGRKEARRNDRFALFAMEAARQAIADAGLRFDNGQGVDTGVLIGTGIGGLLTLLDAYDTFLARGARRVSPLMVPMMMPNAASAAVAIAHGLRGPNLSLATACATGTHAIGEAAEMIRRGQAEVMICGGSEAVLAPVALSGFKNMGALSTRNDEPERASRPFDAERDGFVAGEGAGVVVLESLEHARGHDALIRAELIGYSATADASHITAPDEDGAGLSRAMTLALQDGGVALEAVDYINAHGTSTPLNDRTETKAIRAVFGPHADRLAINSSKSMFGHLIGATGAVEAIVCVRSLETGWMHATINLENPDPECDLDYVPNQPRQVNPRVALSNSSGFGGHNGCLLLRRWEDGA